MNVMKYLKQHYIPGRLMNRSERTKRNYIYIVKRFRNWHVEVHGSNPQIEQMNRQVVEQYMSHLVDRGRKPSTVNKSRAVLLAIWNGAVVTEHHTTPPRHITKLPVEKRTPDAWTLDKADQPVGLMPETIEALQDLAEHPACDETVFGCWTRDRNSDNWPRLTAGLKRILMRAGLPSGERDLWHKIRRTFATQVNAKAGISMAQTLLGHSSPAITERYIDPTQCPENNQAEYLESPVEAA